MPYALFEPRSPFCSEDPPHPPKPCYTTNDRAVAQVFHSYGWIVLSDGKASSPSSPSCNEEDAHYDEDAYDEEMYAMGGGDWTEQEEEDGLNTEDETDHETETETDSGDEMDSEDETDTYNLVGGAEESNSNDTGSSDDDTASGEVGSSITRYASIQELHHTGIMLEESTFQGKQVPMWLKSRLMWMADWTMDRVVDLRYVD